MNGNTGAGIGSTIGITAGVIIGSITGQWWWIGVLLPIFTGVGWQLGRNAE
jgi:hypothetical protein